MTPSDTLLLSLSNIFDGSRGSDFCLTVSGQSVGKATITPVSGGKMVRIETLNIDERLREGGVGRHILREICDMADKAECSITLDAFDYPGMEGHGWLVKLYRSFGFEIDTPMDENGYVNLVRDPHPPFDPAERPEEEDRRKVEKVIAEMAVLSSEWPLEAHLKPYRNSYAPDMAYPAVVLTDLFADTPGEGFGTLYLEELARRCDAAGLTQYTDADGTRSREFYLARGFEVTAGRRDHQLVRWAQDPDLALDRNDGLSLT